MSCIDSLFTVLHVQHCHIHVEFSRSVLNHHEVVWPLERTNLPQSIYPQKFHLTDLTSFLALRCIFSCNLISSCVLVTMLALHTQGGVEHTLCRMGSKWTCSCNGMICSRTWLAFLAAATHWEEGLRESDIKTRISISFVSRKVENYIFLKLKIN